MVSTKSHSPNWSDAEIRFLIGVWKDHHPISKRHNSSVWKSIARELNKLLREQGIASIRTGDQCKAKIKNLEDEYKGVKDHNNKSGNDRETFTYYEDLNEILGCRPKITSKSVIDCRFEDDSLPMNISPSFSSGKSAAPLGELTDSSDELDEGQSLSNALFRREKSAQKNSSKRQSPKSTASSIAGNDDIAFSESLFFKPKRASKTDEKEPGTKQPAVKRPKKRKSNRQSPSNAEYFAFLNESQKRDHEFFERLTEKEGERELKIQQMMFSMVKEVANIFKGE